MARAAKPTAAKPTAAKAAAGPEAGKAAETAVPPTGTGVPVSTPSGGPNAPGTNAPEASTEGEAESVVSPTASPEVKPAPKPKIGRRAFIARSPVIHDGAAVSVGDPVLLTEAEHAPLRAARAIEGDWESGSAG